MIQDDKDAKFWRRTISPVFHHPVVGFSFNTTHYTNLRIHEDKARAKRQRSFLRSFTSSTSPQPAEGFVGTSTVRFLCIKPVYVLREFLSTSGCLFVIPRVFLRTLEIISLGWMMGSQAPSVALDSLLNIGYRRSQNCEVMLYCSDSGPHQSTAINEY